MKLSAVLAAKGNRVFTIGPGASIRDAVDVLAGNNIGKAFEVDLFEGVQRRFTNTVVKLSFEVR